MTLASTSIAALLPAIPPLLLVAVTTGIVVALGLLLNILAERPLLKLSRRLQRRGRNQLAVGPLPKISDNAANSRPVCSSVPTVIRR